MRGWIRRRTCTIVRERGFRLMKQVYAAPLRALAILLLAVTLLAMSSAVAAQAVDRPCGDDAPVDDYQSQGVGLTLPELTALYGPNEVGQGSLYFELDGVELHKRDCDLILVFPLDENFEQVDEIALAESLLPADAELVGTIALGTTIPRSRPTPCGAVRPWPTDSRA